MHQNLSMNLLTPHLNQKISNTNEAWSIGWPMRPAFSHELIDSRWAVRRLGEPFSFLVNFVQDLWLCNNDKINFLLFNSILSFRSLNSNLKKLT